MSSLRLEAGHAAFPPGHDDVLGLVLARAVHHGCDPLVAMLVCRRWRGALLGRAKGVSVRDNAFALLDRTPGLLSLTADNGCTRLPWQVENRGDDVALPPALAHLSKLTSLSFTPTFRGWTLLLRHMAALRGLRCLCVPSRAITSVEALGFLSELTALATLEFVRGVLPSPVLLLSNVLPRLATLPSLTALYLGPTVLQDARLGPQLGALSALTRLTAFALEWTTNSRITAHDCDLSPLTHPKGLAHLGLRGMTSGFSAQLSTLSSITTLTRLALCWHWSARSGVAYEVHHLSRLQGLLSLEVDIHDAPTASFAALSALTALTHLSLRAYESRGNVSGLECVRTLTALRDLTADLLAVTDDDLACLRALTRLSALALPEAYDITWAGLAHVAVLSGLRSLDLGASDVEDFSSPRFGAGELPDLSALGALEELTVAVANEDDFRCLLSLTGLTWLRLRCAYRDERPLLAGAPFLSRLLALRQCQVDGGIVSAEVCTAVNALPNLESVAFDDSDIGLGVLGRLSTPTYLRLEDCVVSLAAIASVSALEQLRELHVGLHYIDDEHDDVDDVAQSLLLVLHPLMQLTRIVLHGAEFPEAGVRRLASVLPALCSVEVNGKLRWDIFMEEPA